MCAPKVPKPLADRQTVGTDVNGSNSEEELVCCLLTQRSHHSRPSICQSRHDCGSFCCARQSRVNQ